MTQAPDHNRVVVDQHTRQAQGYADLTRKAAPPPGADDLARKVDARKTDHALDVACGPGSLSLQLAPYVAQVTGIDITAAMLEQARAAQERAGANNVAWHQGDAADLPFDDGAFDIVASRAAFHHFATPARVLAEMVRVCRPCGRIMVIDITPDHGKSEAYDRMERLRDPSHGHAHGISEFSAMAETLGLGEMRVETRMSGPMAYTSVLATSFPEACSRADLLALMAQDADGGRDELGFRARRASPDAGAPGAETEVLVTYPMSTLIWTKAR